MPNPIDITASSMTSLLGEVESSKSKLSSKTKSNHQSTSTSTSKDQDEYNLSRFKKSSSILKSSKSKPISNKGIQNRIQNDQIDCKFNFSNCKKPPPTINDQLIHDSLKRKTLIYEATIQGKTGGLSEKLLESSTLDIDAKRQESQSSIPIPIRDSSPILKSFKGKFNSTYHHEEEEEEKVEEEEEEEWIESQDEFGRTKLIRIQDLPKPRIDPQKSLNFIQTESAQHLNEAEAQFGPQRSFPILDKSDLPIKPKSPIETYFNPKSEQRQLGISHYHLSNDPIERKRQQDELRTRELQTETQRESNLKSNRSDSIQTSIIEDRKRLIQAKREANLKNRKKLKT
ncbi:hypothetical protein DFH28DRAFT_1057651 [Melampsora americana]|nr:hypothetical protein DFH28DRAFT_1057651 [Melampsora americana]